MIVLDAGKPMTHKRIIEKELEGFGIRLNQKPPNIILKRKEKGGIAITKACPLTKSANRSAQRIAVRRPWCAQVRRVQSVETVFHSSCVSAALKIVLLTIFFHFCCISSQAGQQDDRCHRKGV